jgi:hypothetical protein
MNAQTGYATASKTSATGSKLTRPEALALRDLLEIGGRRTRLELVCWELDISERQARPAWDVAVGSGLLVAEGADELTGETMFRLSERGRFVLRRLKERRGGSR